MQGRRRLRRPPRHGLIHSSASTLLNRWLMGSMTEAAPLRHRCQLVDPPVACAAPSENTGDHPASIWVRAGTRLPRFPAFGGHHYPSRGVWPGPNFRAGLRIRTDIAASWVSLLSRAIHLPDEPEGDQ